jgi:hypothetical protein
MITENTENATKDANVGAQSAAVAPEKAPSKKAASRKKSAPKSQKSGSAAKAKGGANTKPQKAAKKSTKSPKSEEAKAAGGREGSKTEIILGLLRRAKGATLGELMDATSWQPHSCRGFISGTVGKKMGLTVKSEKREDGTRVYSIAK